MKTPVEQDKEIVWLSRVAHRFDALRILVRVATDQTDSERDGALTVGTVLREVRLASRGRLVRVIVVRGTQAWVFRISDQRFVFVEGSTIAVSMGLRVDNVQVESQLRAPSHTPEAAPRLIARWFTCLEAILPKRFTKEELGDALEFMARSDVSPWQRWMKALSASSFVIWNSVREISATLWGRSKPKG